MSMQVIRGLERRSHHPTVVTSASTAEVALSIWTSAVLRRVAGLKVVNTSFMLGYGWQRAYHCHDLTPHHRDGCCPCLVKLGKITGFDGE